jgi:uncharacterized protein (DUF2141 family)
MKRKHKPLLNKNLSCSTIIESMLVRTNASIYSQIRFFSYLLICMLLFSCAQVVIPGGGKRDTYPPRVVKYSPDSAQLNFNSRIIEITFDEYIQLKDLNAQLIVSPPLEKLPDVNVKNKSVTIDLGKQKLKPNTTYSINFGNAIQDINENNSKENFSYIFSTGNFIDSLKVTGKVQNAFDHKSEKNVLAMLYTDMSDSAVFKEQPDYFAKAADDGSFKITNIKEGKYKIVAVKDMNSNYKYDSETETIGFYDSLMNLSNPVIIPADTSNRPKKSVNKSDTLKNKSGQLKNPTDTLKSSKGSSIKEPKKKVTTLELFQETPKKLFIKKSIHNYYGKIVLVFNRGSDSITVNNLTKDKKDTQEFVSFSKSKDTLTYWITNFDKDSLRLQVNNGVSIIDTVEFKMLKMEDALKSKRGNNLKLRVTNNFSGNQTFDLNSDLKLIFSQPLASVDSSAKLTFMEDSVSYQNKFPLALFLDSSLTSLNLGMQKPVSLPGRLNTDKTSPYINHLPLKENTAYHLFIPPGSVTDIFGLTNDTIKIDFKTRELNYYGNLKLKVNLPRTKENYIIQLLDEKENIIRENIISETGTIAYEYLYPKKYKIKLIVDENNNGKWDTGNYLKRIHAEKVIYNAEEITIRSNWDADIEWNITDN